MLEIDQAITMSTRFPRVRVGRITPNGEDLIAIATKITSESGTASAAELESMAQGTTQERPDTSRNRLSGAHLSLLPGVSCS